MSKLGVDVSTHNGTIDWKLAEQEIDFAIIRAGYSNTYDDKLTANVKGCLNNGIPYGLYWFSYALTVEDAIKEADNLCDFADTCNPTYPLCYDWEYDSDSYAKKCDVKMSNAMREKFARAFLSRVEERGYYAMLYSNVDYLNKGFLPLITKYDLWLAHWGIASPSRNCGIWQKTASGYIAGIGPCDLNVAYKDYPYIIKTLKENENEQISFKEKQLEIVKQDYWEKYLSIAEDVLKDKYKTGETRKKLLKEKGYDYDFVQAIVTILS